MTQIIYSARVIDDIDNGKGFWKYQTIGVFRKEGEKEEQVGKYVRNYSSFMNTFHHFRQNGKDLAVFSPEYTCTRIMELPSCRDIGGEEPAGHGFCPVDLYVPSYIDREFKDGNLKGHKYRVDEPDGEDVLKETSDTRAVTPVLHYPFGFVAGCIWGDDTSWKIELLDLSRADEGKLVREARFGYIELPSKLKLREAVRVDGDEHDLPMITIATESRYNLKTGKKYE